YRFDGASNILELIDAIGPDDAPGSADQVFQYDSLYKLISAGSPAYGTLQYRYSPIGNILSKRADNKDPREDVGNYTYGKRIDVNGTGPHAVTGVSGGAYGDLAITYDANGNFRTYGETVYDFDYLDRLFRVRVPSKDGKPGSVSEYRYDYTGQRMVKRVTQGGTTEETLYPFPGFEIRNGVEVKYIFAGSRRLAQVEARVESEYRRNLKAGWNLLSLPLEPSDARLHKVLGSLGAAWRVAELYDTTTQRFRVAHNGEPESERIEIHAGTGCWLYLEQPVELRVSGGAPESTGGLELKAGWNLVGGASLGAASIAQLEKTIPGKFSIWGYDSATQEWKSSRKEGPEFLNNLTHISADSGYWIYMETPVTLQAFRAANALKVVFYLPDHLGSSNVIADMNGEVVEETEFYPYGQVRYRSPGSSFEAAYKFTGKELDAESSLYYYEARYYDGVIGRFITPDPILFQSNSLQGDSLQNFITNPGRLNAYGYVLNNPLRYNDPTGFAEFIRGDVSKGNFGERMLREMSNIQQQGLQYGPSTQADPIAFSVGTGVHRGQKTDCVTATLEAFARASGGDINGIPIADPFFNSLRKSWIIANANNPNWRKGAINALEEYELGQEVFDWQDIRRGDIVQAWKGTSGHSFLIERVHRNEEGLVIGFDMISANKSNRQTVSVGGSDSNAIVRESRGGYGGYKEIYIGRFYDIKADEE
ncbi:RHS repeat-associated core domain-containing protein, partial [Candidatus Poribacteria bacterium]|nr:RHS repeat-associated core domain-containing protein [Candidatus Poribacteria bacterium]